MCVCGGGGGGLQAVETKVGPRCRHRRCPPQGHACRFFDDIALDSGRVLAGLALSPRWFTAGAGAGKSGPHHRPGGGFPAPAADALVSPRPPRRLSRGFGGGGGGGGVLPPIGGAAGAVG